ncbi:hypothetical protein BGZ98_004843, partial [Dissophora globulifera]
APIGSRRVGFTTLNDALYIEGGFDTDTSSQFFSIDLSTSWPTSSPAWSTLKNGQSAAHLALAPISAASNGGSKGSLLTIGGMGNVAFFGSYDIGGKAWSNLTTVKPPYTYLEGQAAASDPNTGLVYIIGGFGNNTFNQLSVFDPKTRSTVSQASATAATSLTDVGAVWVSSRNTVLTFGGSRAPPADTVGLGTSDLNEYDPSSKSWKTMVTEDGSTVVVFGGTPDGNTFFNTIYILDVKSGKWKQGQSAPVARTRMACAFHSYQFIAWGGSSGSSRTTMLNNLPVVYNLNDNKWTDGYNADEKQRKTNIGAIVGGIIAVFAVGAGVGFFLYKRRQRRRAEQDAFHSDATAAAAITYGEDDEDQNIKVLASSPRMGYSNIGYGGYGNDYPLNAVHGGSVEGFHNGMSPAMAAGNVSGNDQYYQMGGEKISSPYTYPQLPASPYSVAQTPMMQSPALIHLQGSNPNPFLSPDDYHPPPALHIAAKATEIQSPAMRKNVSGAVGTYDPFQQYQQSPALQHLTPVTYSPQPSPSPSARAPQMIPESGSTNDNKPAGGSGGYIPPPPM